MDNITQITPDIFKTTTPYMDVYTTVCAIKTPEGVALFDTGSYPEDVDTYILPFLSALGICEKDLRYIILSHNHGDHAGGLTRLLAFFPGATVVSRHPGVVEKYAGNALYPNGGEMLLDTLQIVSIPGHCADALGLLDTRTNTMLTGDSLQLYGLYGSGKWGANISLIPEHLSAIEKLRGMKVDTIVASHDYHPWGYIARGAEEISRYLDTCAEALYKIKEYLRQHPSDDFEGSAKEYNETFGLPTMGGHVFQAIAKAMENGNI